MKLYKGDLSPKDAWAILTTDAAAVCVDVRTLAELAYVGKPDLNSLGKDVLHIEWRLWPKMEQNPAFASALEACVPDRATPILFLCRTGGRSIEAAAHMSSLGYLACYNISNGFEGDLNQQGHRGSLNGWKAEGLLWRQG